MRMERCLLQRASCLLRLDSLVFYAYASDACFLLASTLQTDAQSQQQKQKEKERERRSSGRSSARGAGGAVELASFSPVD